MYTIDHKRGYNHFPIHPHPEGPSTALQIRAPKPTMIPFLHALACAPRPASSVQTKIEIHSKAFLKSKCCLKRFVVVRLNLGGAETQFSSWYGAIAMIVFRVRF
jgi:hypothetical protein